METQAPDELRSPHHHPPLSKVRRGRTEKKHLLKVRKNRDSNQGLGPEAEPLPTMLQEARRPKITNHYNFKPLGIRAGAGDRQAPPPAHCSVERRWAQRRDTEQLEEPTGDPDIHSPHLSPAASLLKSCASVPHATKWSTDSHPPRHWGGLYWSPQSTGHTVGAPRMCGRRLSTCPLFKEHTVGPAKRTP